MEKFLQTNPGLRSRFPIHIDFPDYSQQELLAIAEQFCARRQYRLTAQTRLALHRMLNPPADRDDDNSETPARSATLSRRR
jgi:stage V sporulation protein K